MIYMAVSEASKRWTKALRNWKEALMECSPKSDPGVMKVYQPRSGGRTFDDQEETKAFA
jgi:hypothetical protein